MIQGILAYFLSCEYGIVVMWESLIIYEKIFAEVVGMVCVYVYNLLSTKTKCECKCAWMHMHPHIFICKER